MIYLTKHIILLPYEKAITVNYRRVVSSNDVGTMWFGKLDCLTVVQLVGIQT